MPRAFFEEHVRPNFNEWVASPLNQRLAKNAVADANNMAARMFHYLAGKYPEMLHGARNEGEYRSWIVTNECDDFALARDIADAHKHFELDRISRRITRSTQTDISQLGWGEGRYGEGTFGGSSQLVVTLDDGTKRPLTAIMKNVITMWERLLESASSP